MSGGGLGEALPAETMSFVEPAVKTIFDLSYFIIVTIIGLNVRLCRNRLQISLLIGILQLVFGVIVDTFSEVKSRVCLFSVLHQKADLT